MSMNNIRHFTTHRSIEFKKGYGIPHGCDFLFINGNAYETGRVLSHTLKVRCHNQNFVGWVIHLAVYISAYQMV